VKVVKKETVDEKRAKSEVLVKEYGKQHPKFKRLPWGEKLDHANY
jgi:hypothetical protein